MSGVEMGHYYRRVECGPAIDLKEQASALTQGTAWRVSGRAAPDEVTFSQGSKTWFRLMGAWRYTSKTSRRWPFRARLKRVRGEDRLQVVIEDDFGWWASDGPLLEDAAAHGNLLMEDMLRRLDACSSA